MALSEAFHSLVGAYGNADRTEDSDPPPLPPAAAAGDPETPGAEPEAFLPREGVEAWLMKINRSLGRGSEFRAAEAIMGPGPGGGLTLEGMRFSRGCLQPLCTTWDATLFFLLGILTVKERLPVRYNHSRFFFWCCYLVGSRKFPVSFS